MEATTIRNKPGIKPERIAFLTFSFLVPMHSPHESFGRTGTARGHGKIMKQIFLGGLRGDRVGVMKTLHSLEVDSVKRLS
jgi:hypothetical protein